MRALYGRLMEGWNPGSGAAFAEPLAPAIDFVGFDGTCFKGRDAVAAFHDPLFKTHLKGSRLIGAVTSRRFLSPSVALVHARGSTIMRGETRASPARDSTQTLVAVKDGDSGPWSRSRTPVAGPLAETPQARCSGLLAIGCGKAPCRASGHLDEPATTRRHLVRRLCRSRVGWFDYTTRRQSRLRPRAAFGERRRGSNLATPGERP